MKPVIVFYNPPAALRREEWQEPVPLNVLACASLLNENEFEIVIVQDFPEQAKAKIAPFLERILFLGISLMTGHQITNGLALAEWFKEESRDGLVVVGGYHPTALPEQTLANPLIDLVVRGYGEEVMKELAQKLKDEESWEEVEGLSFKKDNKIVHNKEREIPDLNSLPPLPYHLFDLESFFKRTKSRTFHYVSSRGCPHQCGFCADFVIYKRRWNALEAERVVKELSLLYEKYHFEAVRFFDSNLFVSEERIKLICQGLIKNNVKFRWLRCNGDAFILSRFSDETLALMKEAGIENILIGIESGYPKALLCIGKRASNEENFIAKAKLFKHKINIGFSFMFGFPYDLPKKELEEEHKKEIIYTMQTIAAFSQNYVLGDYYMLFVFTAYPGVRLSERYKKLGWQEPSSLEEWGKVNLNSTAFSPWISGNILKIYPRCLEMNWFLMRKLERNIFRGNHSRFLRRFASFVDRLARKWVAHRISKSYLYLPLPLKIMKIYYSSKDKIKTGGFWLAVKKRL